jgi:hypothetical protein
LHCDLGAWISQFDQRLPCFPTGWFSIAFSPKASGFPAGDQKTSGVLIIVSMTSTVEVTSSSNPGKHKFLLSWRHGAIRLSMSEARSGNGSKPFTRSSPDPRKIYTTAMQWGSPEGL